MGPRLIGYGLIAVVVLAGCSKPPDYQEMRRHVVSKLTDAQIREAYELASKDYETERAALKRAADRHAAEQEEKNKKCLDPAYAERNDCSGDGLMSGYVPQPQPLHQFREARIMGPCLYVQTRSEAREKGCLP